MRTVPELDFRRDSSYEYGDRIERLFSRLQAEGRMPAEPDRRGGARRMTVTSDSPGWPSPGSAGRDGC